MEHFDVAVATFTADWPETGAGMATESLVSLLVITT